MLSERRQFRILYRDFLNRVVDLEILAAGGEAQNLLVQLAAILASFSLVLVVVLSPSYRMSRLPIDRLLVAAWGDELYLIGTTIAVVGIFTLLAWNSLLPERRDSVVLGPLPVRLRTIFLSKSAAVATALAGAAAAVNVFTGFAFPTMVNPGGNDLGGVWRCLLAWWITMFAASLFTFCALQAMQGLAAQFLSYPVFLRVSGVLQLAAFLAILGIYFLVPSFATEAKLPQHPQAIAWLPAYWFLGLFQKLAGSSNPMFDALAARALRNLAIAGSVAGVTYVLAWRRNIRRIIEQPDIEPGDRSGIVPRLGRIVIFKSFAGPVDRAIILFTARTIARSGQHRLMLAVYGGVGLPLGAAFINSFLRGTTNERWDTTNPGFLAVSIIMLIFTVVGMRAVFSLPQALPANWVFQMTAVHRPATYFSAVRKALYLLSATPVLLVAAIFYLIIWPGRPALEHTVVLGLLAVILIEKCTYQFRKIPFACSYLPGGANLKMRVGIYVMILLVGVSIASSIESWSLAREERYLLLFTLLLAYGIRCRRRTVEFADSPDNRIQFEDLADAEVSPLDLRLDGAWSSNDAYVDSIDTTFGRSLKQRLRPFLIGAAALVVCGFIYEHVNAWLDHRRYPQIGRSVDIGGRSLNIYCSGEGSPTVILEAGHGRPGYDWLLVQPEIAKLTRTCWYDRAGLGWSDSGPFPNTVDQMTRDLHALLQAASIPPPYILAGHSLGGWIVRVYNSEYPSEVAGLVLVDAPHEDLLKRIPDIPRQQHPESFRYPAVQVAKFAGQIGLLRLMAPIPDVPPPGVTQEQWNLLSGLQWMPKAIAAEPNEVGAGRGNVERVRAAGHLEDLPLVVLTAGLGLRPGQQQIKNELGDELAQRSVNGKNVIVHSDHMIHLNAPEAVIEAIEDVLNACRRTVPDTSSSVRRASADR